MNRGTCARGRRGTWETSSSPAAELRRYRQAKATKRGGMGDEESERADGAMKRGSQPEGTPRSKGRAGTWQPAEGTMDETPGLVPISTKLERIATLAQQRLRPAAHDAGPSYVLRRRSISRPGRRRRRARPLVRRNPRQRLPLRLRAPQLSSAEVLCAPPAGDRERRATRVGRAHAGGHAAQREDLLGARGVASGCASHHPKDVPESPGFVGAGLLGGWAQGDAEALPLDVRAWESSAVQHGVPAVRVACHDDMVDYWDAEDASRLHHGGCR
jgi:hypothetical protein